MGESASSENLNDLEKKEEDYPDEKNCEKDGHSERNGREQQREKT